MRLTLSDADAAFRDDLREFFTTQIPAEIRERAREGRVRFPDDVVTAQRILNERGIAVPNWPVEWGGKDWTPLQRHIWLDEMQLACVPEPLAFNASMVGPVIAAFGSQELKERFLPPTANLDIWWCQGFSEPEAGSDLASLRTTAVRDGDDYVSTARRPGPRWRSTPTGSSVLVRTDPNAPKRQAGISFLLVDMKTPGITVRPIKLIDGGYEVNEVFFEDVRVPADQLVGEENSGWSYAKFLLGNERTGIAGVGTTKVRLAQAKEHAAQTPTEHGTLLDDPLFAARVAEVENELLALELTQLRSVVPSSATASRTRRRRSSSCGAASLQQAATELLVDVAGPDSLPFRAGDDIALAGVGAARRAEVPELPQGLDLRRIERSAAHHHRLDDPRIVRRAMDFELTDEQALLRDTTRELLARSYDAENAASRSSTPTSAGAARSGGSWPRSACSGSASTGGRRDGAGPSRSMAVLTEIGRRLAPEPVARRRAGPRRSDRRRRRRRAAPQILADVAEGQTLLAFAHQEPGMRWPDVARRPHVLSSKVIRGPLTGRKNPVLHGDCADVFVVSAALPDGGVGLFLVDADATAGAAYRDLRRTARRAARPGRRCRRSRSATGGDATSAPCSDALVRHQSALCAEAVGAMEEALRLTTEYLKTRKQFGVPLSKFQTLTQRAADMYVSLELARSMSLYAAMSIADGNFDPVIASRAKLQIGRSARHIGAGGDPDARRYRHHRRVSGGALRRSADRDRADAGLGRRPPADADRRAGVVRDRIAVIAQYTSGSRLE